MKFDADKLRAEAEAHRKRLQGPLWTDNGDRNDESWLAALRQEVQQPPNPLESEPVREHAARSQPTDFESLLSAQEPTPHPIGRELGQELEPAVQEILPRLDALDHAVAKLTAMLSRRPIGGGGASAWLASAAGDPHTYDAPDAERKGVCVRVLPGTYAQLQQLQRKMGLRTIAGAWEFLLRLGFAAVERGAV